MEKVCLECGQKIVGRSDKKFCDDACRNTFNNKRNVSDKNLIRNTNNHLKKNYRILEFLNTKEKTKVSRNQLENLGFNFNLFTTVYITKTGNQYYYCYNQGYLKIDTDWYLLVKNKEN